MLRAGQDAVAEETFEVVRALEGRWAMEKDKEAGVFLLLHCHMWLQLFLQPDLATEVLEEPVPQLVTEMRSRRAAATSRSRRRPGPLASARLPTPQVKLQRQ